MPRFDGTGPKGEGEMTGRGRGYCIVPFEDVKSPIIKRQLESDTSQNNNKNQKQKSK